LIGVIDIAVGYGLWKMRRWAAILGMLLAVMGIVIAYTFGGLMSNSMYWQPPLRPDAWSVAVAYFSTACMYVYILFFVSIAISWKSFQTQTA
jgi:divalent metal cation (Fe/Co/Zn/Cd) transporter